MRERGGTPEETAGGAASPPLFAFDPFGPEKACRDGKAAFEAQELERAVLLYARAVGRLHDLYVLGDFRSRTPSATDAVAVDGLVVALEVLRSRHPDVDVGPVCSDALAAVDAIAAAAQRSKLDAGLFVTASARLREGAGPS